MAATPKELKPVVLSLPEFGESVSYTGETIRIPRLEVPVIRVSYKDEGDEQRVCPKGEFIEYNISTKASKALGKKINVQILHHRQSLNAYKDLGGGKSESYYTPEISMKAKTAPLFMAKADASGRQNGYLMEGEIKKGGPLRSQFPDLRYQRSLYVLHDGVLKNLVIYGASFSGFIDFTKAIQGKSSASVIVELTTKKEKTGAVTYFPIVFTPKEPVDMKIAEPTLKQLSVWFDEYDSRIAKQQSERAEQATIDRGDGPTEAPANPEPTPPLKFGEVRKTTTAQEAAKEASDRRATIAEQVQEVDEERASIEKEMEEKLGL